MKTYRIIGLIILFSLSTVACNNEKSTSEKIMEFAEKLVFVIDEFEKAREKVVQTINEFANKVDKYINGNTKNISETANQWEKDWKIVSDEINKLETQFNEVENSSKKYFDQLELLTDNITNTDLRSSEEKKNEELKERWRKVYDEADAYMQSIRGILNEGNDFRNVLLSSAMRAKIDDNIEQMKGISRKAKKILGDLAKFPIESKKVLKGEINATDSKKESKKNEEKPKEKVSAEKEDETEYLNPTQIKASSFQAGEGLVFKPENVADEDLQTWWSPKTSDKLDKEWIMLAFAKEENMSGIEIHGGSHYPNFKNIGDLYDKNYRIESAVLEFSDGSEYEITLLDVDKIQTINFPKRKSKSVKLTVHTVFPTTRWKDACISHLKIIR